MPQYLVVYKGVHREGLITIDANDPRKAANYYWQNCIHPGSQAAIGDIIYAIPYKDVSRFIVKGLLNVEAD